MNTMEAHTSEDNKSSTMTLSKVQSERLNRYMQSADTTDLIINYYSNQ